MSDVLAIDSLPAETLADLIPNLKAGDRFRHNGQAVTVVESPVVDGERRLLATSDGERVNTAEWHRGIEQPDAVYFVTLSATRSTHGFADSWSRRVTQVG